MKKALVLSLVLALTLCVFTGVTLAKDKEKAKDAKASPDQEKIQKVLDGWKTAAAAASIEKLMPLYSEKFSSFEYGDKAGLKKFIEDSISAGYLKDCEVNLANAKTTINKEKGTAAVTPIEMKANFGSATIDLNLTKEKDAWMITGMEVQQY